MKKFALIFILLLFLFVACSGDDSADTEPTETEAETERATEPLAIAEPPEEEEPEEDFEEEEGYAWWMDGYEEEEAPEEIVRERARHFCFLTGREVSFSRQRRRPVAIVINNIRQAQPTYGTGAADIIYEFLIEGGQARLMMLLTDYERVPVFGSIRSARNYFIDIVQGHDAIFVHAGGTTGPGMAYAVMNYRNIDRIDGVNRVERRDGFRMSFHESFFRDAERRRTMAFEHTLMTSGEGIASGIRRAGYRARHNSEFQGSFRFHREFQQLPGGVDNIANYVAVPFSGNTVPEFIFNPADGLYYRRQFGAAHIDAATGEQLRFENVIVMFAEYTDLRTPQGYLSCQLTGTGFGFYITGGRFVTITWRKDTHDSQLYFFNLDGSYLYLNPGRTFICVTSTAFNKRVVINADLHDIG